MPMDYILYLIVSRQIRQPACPVTRLPPPPPDQYLVQTREDAQLRMLSQVLVLQAAAAESNPIILPIPTTQSCRRLVRGIREEEHIANAGVATLKGLQKCPFSTLTTSFLLLSKKKTVVSKGSNNST